jgi:rod shape-determining protein MreC
MRRTLTLLTVICLGHVLLISAQVQSRSGVPVLESAAFGAFAGVQRSITAVTDTGWSFWTNYVALRGAARENEELRRRILDLEGQIQEQRALANQARILEDTLGLRRTQSAPTLAARVIAGSPTPNVLTVTVDRGSEDGIEPDMAVIGAKGVVGRVMAPVVRKAATVQLLVDQYAGAAVTFERAAAGGVVVGNGTSSLRAKYVPVLAVVQAGERVLTSGQDGVFPPGFLVGTVETVAGQGAEREITIRPAVDFSHVDLVLVLLAKPPKAGEAVE